MSDEAAAAMRAVGVMRGAQDAAPRARLYLRVSTGEQTVENQGRELRAMAEQRGLRVTATYVEAAQSGAKSDRSRAVLAKVLADAHAGQFAPATSSEEPVQADVRPTAEPGTAWTAGKPRAARPSGKARHAWRLA